ncbi:hypothetical protein M3Y94_00563300 [Aphelenchoides besseyi]|nr:hypothetical protein M3Y94_00563300 [Aphelenchoides besseyi]
MNESNVPANDRHWMGKFTPARPAFHDTIDGRFVISDTAQTIKIVDLFHSKTTELRFDFSLATVDGVPLKTSDQYRIEGAYALDLSTMIVRFDCYSGHSSYLGVARTDFDRSLMIVQQTIRLSTDQIRYSSLIPQSYPPNLHEGLILWTASYYFAREGYFLLKMDTDNQLRASRINVPVEMKAFGCFNGFLYGLTVDISVNPGDVNSPSPTHLVGVSLANGEHFRALTSNYEIVKGLSLSSSLGLPRRMCLIGKTLFVYKNSRQNEEARTVSLNLETLEWKNTMISLDSVQPIGSDGKRTLILTTVPNSTSLTVYRYVFNEPDKLSDLVWLRLKRIFDARPLAYEYILSQLPANFKPKCPFPQS